MYSIRHDMAQFVKDVSLAVRFIHQVDLAVVILAEQFSQELNECVVAGAHTGQCAVERSPGRAEVTGHGAAC